VITSGGALNGVNYWEWDGSGERNGRGRAHTMLDVHAVREAAGGGK
jgi:hypothetical protein